MLIERIPEKNVRKHPPLIVKNTNCIISNTECTNVPTALLFSPPDHLEMQKVVFCRNFLVFGVRRASTQASPLAAVAPDCCRQERAINARSSD